MLETLFPTIGVRSSRETYSGKLMMWISSSSCKFLLKELYFFVFNKCNWVTDGFSWIVFFLANGLLAIVARQLEKSER